jgi:abortive infection bacteriophage resistance protein
MATVSFAKQALSYADQIALLEHRGMVVADHQAAEATLSRVNFYRLSAYWYPFRMPAGTGSTPSTLAPGTTFESVLALYDFDRKLRLLVLDALERVEVAMRTAVTYHLGMTYGAFGHENQSNFHHGFDHATWLAHLHTETYRSSDAFVSHYQQKYLGFPSMPIWMMTEVISLGSLSRMFKGMSNTDKQTIAAPLNIQQKRLQDWLHVLTYVRNVCAHHSRLWNRTLAIRPSAMSEPEWNNPLLPRLDRIFCILLILRYMMRQTGNGTTWRDQCNALLQPIAANTVWRNAMGMSLGWQTHPFWV